MMQAARRAVTAARRAGAVALLSACASTAAQGLTEPGTEFQECDACPVMVVIPAGSYLMGSPPAPWGRFYREGTVRTVTFPRPFALGKYEVTFEQWAPCVAEGKCEEVKDEGWGRGRRPVINVNWLQAKAYVDWLANKTGKPYRLPSEAEWEYAARAGAGQTRFFDLPAERVCEHANLHDLTANKKFGYEWEHVPCSDGSAETAPVGSFRPNAFGLHDMLGNVWEWTMDCSRPVWRDLPKDGSPWLRGDCTERAFRGGSWLELPPVFLLQGHRYKYIKAQYKDLGFRVARTLP
ncbi:MAG TPA: SUMF1/EgtB/PvdO family nonheme iron enzyme [Burkholderiales bacterium]|nr:SUMF1/EgtB/PvdO family nonheme iron enzyme [Burkholderiales bacterium]